MAAVIGEIAHGLYLMLHFIYVTMSELELHGSETVHFFYLYFMDTKILSRSI